MIHLTYIGNDGMELHDLNVCSAVYSHQPYGIPPPPASKRIVTSGGHQTISSLKYDASRHVTLNAVLQKCTNFQCYKGYC